MALSGSAARRYAEALYQIAVSEKAVDDFATSLQHLQQALSRDALRALRNPGIPLRARRRPSSDAPNAGTAFSLRAIW